MEVGVVRSFGGSAFHWRFDETQGNIAPAYGTCRVTATPGSMGVKCSSVDTHPGGGLGGTFDIGFHHLRYLITVHVPHNISTP